MQQLDIAGLTMCTSKAALAAGTTTTYSTTGATLYCIKGKAYSVAAKTNAATPTTDINTAAAFVGVDANKGSVFVFGYNAAGAVKVAQGSVEDLDASGNFVIAPNFPALPEDFAPFGYLIIQAGSTASTWTLGTSNQASATGITYTRQDVMAMPSRVQLP